MSSTHVRPGKESQALAADDLLGRCVRPPEPSFPRLQGQIRLEVAKA